MERQHISQKANESEYDSLYRDLQPGLNVYWSGFGDPPSLTYRARFNDIEYNRNRQKNRTLIKGRFAGGNLGWILQEDIELFAAVYAKPLAKPTFRHEALLDLINCKPLTIHQMKEDTGMLVKEITPTLHRLQEAFLIYEDQHDGEWDRCWHKFADMFPNIDLHKYTRQDAIKTLILRYAYRFVCFSIKMIKSFYKLPEKEIKSAIVTLIDENVLTETDYGYILTEDVALLQTYNASPQKSVYAMHRNDVLIKSNEHWLKEKFVHSYPDTLHYLMIDGEIHGAVAGKFRYTPEDIEDIILDISPEEAEKRKDEIIHAIHSFYGVAKIKRYQGEEI